MPSNAQPSGLASHWSKPRLEFRLPRARRIFVLIGTAVLGCVSAGFTVFAIVVMLGPQWQLGLFLLAPLACFMGALTGYVGRDLRGVWGLHVVLGGDSLELDLPAGRSLIHRPPAQRLIVPYADIAAIETRLEAYSTLGMETVQRAYALRRKGGDIVFLFEDRALATGFESADFQQLAADIASRAGVPLHDLGMVEGKGRISCRLGRARTGLVGTVAARWRCNCESGGTRPPPGRWSSPSSLSPWQSSGWSAPGRASSR